MCLYETSSHKPKERKEAYFCHVVVVVFLFFFWCVAPYQMSAPQKVAPLLFVAPPLLFSFGPEVERPIKKKTDALGPFPGSPFRSDSCLFFFSGTAAAAVRATRQRNARESGADFWPQKLRLAFFFYSRSLIFFVLHKHRRFCLQTDTKETGPRNNRTVSLFFGTNAMCPCVWRAEKVARTICRLKKKLKPKKKDNKCAPFFPSFFVPLPVGPWSLACALLFGGFFLYFVFFSTIETCQKKRKKA
nr:hypothetical protein [Pandoravirus aubagnensis]